MRPGQAAPVFLRDRRKLRRGDAASMRPGQAAPVFVARTVEHPRESGASMRPGQAAPVFASHASNASHMAARFNEAGAGCPGILGSGWPG